MKKDIYVAPVLLSGMGEGGIEPEDLRHSQGGNDHPHFENEEEEP